MTGECSCAHAPCEHDAARDPSLKARVKMAGEPITDVRPVIVGESNPYGGDDYYAMFPEPAGCAGDRLCRLVMGLRQQTYLKQFERVNLLRGDRWSAPKAREASAILRAKFSAPDVWILLGRKVAEAFEFYKIQPPVVVKRYRSYVLLPHPSGRNRAWGHRDLAVRCRSMLQQVLPSVPFGELEREARCWQCGKLWETECGCPLPDPMCDPDGYAEAIAHYRRARASGS